jgi:hypothetical protein
VLSEMHCLDCERAELLDRSGRLARIAYQAIWNHSDRRGRHPLEGIGRAFTALMGQREPSHYDRHRDEYARTGDPRELRRMLRQV